MGPDTSTSRARINGETQELAPPFFYHSSADAIPHFWEQHTVYERVTHEVLGDQEDSDGTPELLDRSRCFNCGDPSHRVTECPFRLNRDLIALSRQYYQFYQGSLGLGNWQRIHTVEAWRQQRLNWIEEFEPGKLKGELLKEALESSQEEWLKNISVWGYPRGWLSETDPRKDIRSRIWNECDGDVALGLEDQLSFELHGDEDHVETLSFQHAFRVTQHTNKAESNDDEDDIIPPSKASSARSNSPTTTSSDYSENNNVASSPPPLVRWANYPSSYFSSQHLVLYNPPPPSESWSSTRFSDTSAYISQFFVPLPPPPSEEPPPLPPSSPPPPLPPPPPSGFDSLVVSSSSGPHQHLDPQTESSAVIDHDQAELSECDMDLSDSD
ncbi:hypothetical protein GALMADRAFT_625842 [Galerina marginata CBS 339.88]|uniref:CCHC-type domain-containing protein n=1 Tax=Galerina marginata (strain CBS 339.88) TaxID=685588 RepID=A0A067SRS6_GALM3|nr:hypothetical protein GALMADRAFT_625842 [Galerina marginata CBS 339.88]